MQERMEKTLALLEHIDWPAVALITVVIGIIVLINDPELVLASTFVVFSGATVSAADLAIKQHGESVKLGEELGSVPLYLFVITLMGGFFMGFGGLVAVPILLLFESVLNQHAMLLLVGLGTLALLPIWLVGNMPAEWYVE